MVTRNLNPATRLFGIVARNAPRVVIIRRGPTKHVLLVTWDTLRHEFRAGQWFKGRIYEERCDLSPSGDKLIYLAANQRPPYHAWTAVSRPPFLTALALWPNLGTWGGGGLFESECSILLNRHGGPGRMPDEFKLPKNVRVRSIGEWAGRGEDEPINSARMKRDGWTLVDEGTTTEYQKKGPLLWQYVRPRRWHKAREPFTLERRILGIGEREGPWYVTEHTLLGADSEPVLDFGRSDWADWSNSGELLLARDGKLSRVRLSPRDGPGDVEELIDLSGLRFQQVIPTAAALSWDAKHVAGRKIR
jgi:hypothetical protein